MGHAVQQAAQLAIAQGAVGAHHKQDAHLPFAADLIHDFFHFIAANIGIAAVTVRVRVH